MSLHYTMTTPKRAARPEQRPPLCVASALLSLSAAALCMTQTPALAQTGISEERVSLPEGPGSLEGVGENISMNANMGSMSYEVMVELPEGFAGMTPDLTLRYNSGAGSSVVGMGWSFQQPSIERMTYRGLPEYDLDDDFCADGGTQLVRIPNVTPPTWRARYEGGFVRYRWHEAGDGADGYWTAEYPDGRVGYFGADATGETVTAARVEGERGTFRYHLVEMVDVYGHAVRYSYRRSGEVALLERVGWVHKDDGPRYSVVLSYEDRSDGSGEAYLSDAKPGFNELLTERLRTMEVFSGADMIRRYELDYERYVESGGFTRLVSVKKYGLTGELYPVVFSFRYSRALGGVCEDEEGCERAFMVDMGRLGVNLGSGRATLLDINGDALPDMLHTPEDGAHQFFMNVPSVDGQSQFQTPPVFSEVGNNAHQLGRPTSQVLDVNGDGFTDLLNTVNGQVLINRGQGDWAELSLLSGSEGLPDFSADFDFDEGELGSIRFMDYDGDKRIDVIRATLDSTSVFRNTENGFQSDPRVSNLGVGFPSGDLDLADMNGDGLLDVARILPGELTYRLNLGWGQWSNWRSLNTVPYSESERRLVQLEDINGDALADVVVVSGDQVKYALNRNGTDFFSSTTLTSSEVNGVIPARDDTTDVLFADMNGNGSSDVVWVTNNGHVRYLELFPVRPNLLSRIENGVGQVTEVRYATSLQHAARDEQPWTYKLPHPMLVVDETETWDTLSGVREVTRYAYHNGFYDGVEKQFRGYERVEAALLGDEDHESGLVLSSFDVGADDPYRHGLLLRREATSADRPLYIEENSYSDCPLTQIPSPETMQAAGLRPIRYVCSTRQRKTHQEGAPEEQWRITESTSDYDGYGNVTLSAELGVVSTGSDACAPCTRDESVFGAPCGAQCVGDELFTETEFVSPDNTGGRWILHAPYRTRTYGRAGSSQVKEQLAYYDGPAFEGLPLGQLTRGDLTRATERIDADADAVIEAERSRYDAHGNVVESLDPNGDPDAHRNRRQYTYDDDNLRIIAADILLEDPDGAPYTLRQEIRYERLFDRPTEATGWMRVVGGEVLTARRSMFYQYDGFGRLISTVKPGDDTLESPTEAITYELGNPTSRIISRSRTRSGEAMDQEAITCVDGRGRTFQERIRLSEGRYQVTGFTVYNTRSGVLREYQPYIGTSGACDSEPPEEVPFTHTTYDATYRPLTQREPDADVYGTPSMTRTAYGPLSETTWDHEDTDPSSPHADTPTVRRFDGLGRLTALERVLSPDTAPAVTEPEYDELGRLHRLTDAEGNTKVQRYDLLDRLVQVTDPNSAGDTTWSYDAAGNTIATTDGRGVTVRTEFDGDNRPVARWDEAEPDKTRIAWRYDTPERCPPTECTFTEGMIAEVRYPLPGGEVGEDHFGYDVRSRSVMAARVLEGFRTTQARTWDNVDRLTATTYPDGTTLTYQYDDASRLTAVPDYIQAITYTDRGLTAATRYTNGSESTMSYDARLRLTALQTEDAQGKRILGYGYQRDRANNILSLTDDATADALLPDRAATYRYDAWYRLSQATLGDAETMSYAYDHIDNILTADSTDPDSAAHLGALDYSSSAPNAVTRAGDISYDYNDAGHVTERAGLTLTRDFLGRLTEARTADTTRATFSYSSGAERVLVSEDGFTTHQIAPDFELRDGITALYVRAGQQRVALIENDRLAPAMLSDLAPTTGDTRLTPTPDARIGAADAWVALAAREGIVEVETEISPSAPMRLLSSAVRRLLLETQPTPTTFFHHDHLGSLTATTSASGQLIGARTFYPTGLDREVRGWVDRYGFTGQEQDPSTGLLHFLHRYLDPRSGRWMSIDPMFASIQPGMIRADGQSQAAYAYVANNMINLVDQDGRLGFFKKKGIKLATREASKSVPNTARAGVTTVMNAGAWKASRVESSFLHRRAVDIKIGWRSARVGVAVHTRNNNQINKQLNKAMKTATKESKGMRKRKKDARVKRNNDKFRKQRNELRRAVKRNNAQYRKMKVK